jgi:hypothetical protein
MFTRISTIIEFEKIFKWLKDNRWNPQKENDAITGIYGNLIELEIKYSYEVEIHSIDDPSDSESGENIEDPVEFITEFVGGGALGEELLKKLHSSSPENISYVLNRLASRINEFSKKEFSRVLKFVLASLNKFPPVRISTSDFKKHLESMKNKLEGKGWDVKEVYGSLVINVGDVFEATIKPDGYMYYVGLTKDEDVHEMGFSTNPLEKIENFMGSDEVNDTRGAPTIPPRGSKPKETPSKGEEAPSKKKAEPPPLRRAPDLESARLKRSELPEIKTPKFKDRE